MSVDDSQEVADIIDGLGDDPTPLAVYQSTRNYDERYIAAAAATMSTPFNGGNITAPVYILDLGGTPPLKVDADHTHLTVGANSLELSCEGGSSYVVLINTPTVDAVAVSDSGCEFAHNGVDRIKTDATGIGFFNHATVAQPTGVAVTAEGIHAALVSLGLITA